MDLRVRSQPAICHASKLMLCPRQKLVIGLDPHLHLRENVRRMWLCC